MQRKKTSARRSAQNKTVAKPVKQKKAKPFSDVGEIIGGAIGKMFNMDLSGAGRWLGNGIGRVFGSGDYTLAGPMPDSNVLVNAAQIPKFSTTKATNVVCHREYLGDVLSTTSFVNMVYRLNPAEDRTFPWLASIAQSYQEYKFHGLIFEFRPLITDFVTAGSPGFVIMATNYNAAAPIYTDKYEMENSEFAASCKPTTNLVHGVECAPSQTSLPLKYVRADAPTTEKQNYDLGNFQIATNNPNLAADTILGELWVSYCVEFFKPVLPKTLGGIIGQAVVGRTNYTNTSPLGLVGYLSRSTLDDFQINSGSGISFTANPGTYYQMQIIWQGTAAGNIVYPTVTYVTGAVGKNFYTPSIGAFNNAFLFSPEAGFNVATCSLCATFMTVNAPQKIVAITITNSGTTNLPLTGTVEIIITKLDDTLIEL